MITRRRHRRLVVGVNAVKGAVALVFLGRPKEISAWVGPTVEDPGGRILLRAFGVRDLSLSVGAATASTVAEQRRWLLAGGACDLLDAAVTMRLARRAENRLGPRTTLTAAWAGASGLACLALAAASPIDGTG